jgi:hypothetical protein
MRYVALDTVEQHIERVKRRAARGGHSASETTLRRIHASSLANLPIALNPEESGIEILRIYDNSQPESRPVPVLAGKNRPAAGSVSGLAAPRARLDAAGVGKSPPRSDTEPIKSQSDINRNSTKPTRPGCRKPLAITQLKKVNQPCKVRAGFDRPTRSTRKMTLMARQGGRRPVRGVGTRWLKSGYSR